MALLIALLGASAGLAILVAGWLGLLTVMGASDRWREVAARFPAKERPAGKAFRQQAGRIQDGGWYSSILTVIPTDAGLYVEIERLFSFRHPPLLLPWSVISGGRERRGIFFGLRALELTVGANPEMTIWFRKKAGQVVRTYFNRYSGQLRTI